MNQWLQDIGNLKKLGEWWDVLKMKLMWHYQHYGISENIKELKAFNN